MLTKRLVLAFAAFAALWCVSVPAFACSCPKGINPLKKSEAIFFGTAEKIRARGSSDRITFKIEKIYKGEEPDTVSLYVNRFHHDCGIRFEEGKKYMVYAYDFYPRGVATSMCFGTYQTDEMPTGESWRDVDVDIPDSTDIEEEMRKLARKIVGTCATKAGVTDAGFSLVLSPNGDPMRPSTEERLSKRDEEFAQCMADEFLKRSDLPETDHALLVKGWWQQGDRTYPILLDELPCDDTCADWGSIVKSALLDVRLPTTGGAGQESTAEEANLAADRQKCVEEGTDSIFEVADGEGRAALRRRKAMFVDCAVTRGEFDKALEYAKETDIRPVFLEAIKWAAAEGEGTLPVSTTIGSFPAFYFKTRKKPSPGDFRVLRTAFLGSEEWANQPLFLEAFAQSIIADDSTTQGMRDFAALAYRKAARLVPESDEAYRELARHASKSNGVDVLVAELDEAYAKAVAEREKQQAELMGNDDSLDSGTNMGAEDAVVEQPAEEEGDNMVVLLGGLLLLAAIAGGLFVFSRRRNM